MANRESSLSERPIGAGLLSGSAAALIGSLVQLPLRAPTDLLFNSGAVTAGALLAGLAAGVIWSVAGRGRRRAYLLLAVWAVAFGVTVVIAVAAGSYLDRSVSYVVPLAAVVLGVTGALTPALATTWAAARRCVVVAAVAAAIGVGAALAGVGDQESGRLELPARSASLLQAD